MPSYHQHHYASKGGNIGYGFTKSSNEYTTGIPISSVPSPSDVGGATLRLHYADERLFLVHVANTSSLVETRVSLVAHYFEFIFDDVPLIKCDPRNYLSAYQLLEDIYDPYAELSVISCHPVDTIDHLISKYKVNNDNNLARLFKSVYYALLGKKEGYAFVLGDRYSEQSLDKTSCEIMTILHHYMPAMRRRLTFISDSNGKNIPQFGFCFSRTEREMSMNKSTRWGNIIMGSEDDDFLLCFSCAMVWLLFEFPNMYAKLDSFLNKLLDLYRDGCSSSVGELLFPLALISKMPEEFINTDICEDLKRYVNDAVKTVTKYLNGKEDSNEFHVLRESLPNLHQFMPNANKKNKSAYASSSQSNEFDTNEDKYWHDEVVYLREEVAELKTFIYNNFQENPDLDDFDKEYESELGDDKKENKKGLMQWFKSHMRRNKDPRNNKP